MKNKIKIINIKFKKRSAGPLPNRP